MPSQSSFAPDPAAGRPGGPRLRVVTIVGTRPEAIKLAPVVAALQRRPGDFEHILIASGQHRELLHQALGLFGLEPQVDLELMEPDQDLTAFAARALQSLSAVLVSYAPDVVVVQGDTTTAMAAALAAFHRQIPVAHVEAGLRTGDSANPFPEEANRRIAGILATLHFAPTPRAQSNLMNEGIPQDRIHVTGNTIVDALGMLDLSGPVSRRGLERVLSEGRRIVLVTAHRRESFGPPLRSICDALRTLAGRFNDLAIIYPVHPNPAVADTVRHRLGRVAGVHLIEPLDYPDLLRVMRRSTLILTDSGGIQEEAPSFGVPVLVLRNATERPELIESGGGFLVGTDAAAIVREAARLLADPGTFIPAAENPFGDGRAAERIADILAALRLPCVTSRPAVEQSAAEG